MKTNPATKAFPYPTIDIDRAKLIKVVADCRAAHVTYGLGAKAPSMKAIPGKDFKAIDCSGFVRYALFIATGGSFVLNDGSVQQREAIDAAGFKRSEPEALVRHDNVVRIAFLRPEDSPEKVGHVFLVLNGRTIESHGGGVGPDSRPVDLGGWMGKTIVYVLDMPEDLKA